MLHYFYSNTAGILSGPVALSSLIVLSTEQTSASVNVISEMVSRRVGDSLYVGDCRTFPKVLDMIIFCFFLRESFFKRRRLTSPSTHGELLRRLNVLLPVDSLGNRLHLSSASREPDQSAR